MTQPTYFMHEHVNVTDRVAITGEKKTWSTTTDTGLNTGKHWFRHWFKPEKIKINPVLAKFGRINLFN